MSDPRTPLSSLEGKFIKAVFYRAHDAFLTFTDNQGNVLFTANADALFDGDGNRFEVDVSTRP